VAEFVRRGRGFVVVQIRIPAERYDGLCALARSPGLALRALRLGIPRYLGEVETSLVHGSRAPAQPSRAPRTDEPHADALGW